MSPSKQATFENFLPSIEFALDRPAPDLTPDTHLYEQAGMDSMGAVALVVEVQRCFRVRIADERVRELMTPRQWIDDINSLTISHREAK